MKQIFAAILLFFGGKIFAATPKIPQILEEDLIFLGGALIENVVEPENADASSGKSFVKISGPGSVILKNKINDGFPQLRFFGETTITSTRFWNPELAKKNWWSGQISPPAAIRNPEKEKIIFFEDRKSDFEILKTYRFGLENEIFDFSTPAEIYFKVDAKDDEILWFALKENDDTWQIARENNCEVIDQICATLLSSVNEIAIIRENFRECDPKTIPHGKIGDPPNCAVTCDDGFIFNFEKNSCDSINEIDTEKIFSNEKKETAEIRQGYFRFTESRHRMSDRYRGLEEQLKKEPEKKKDDRYLEHVRNSRDHFKMQKLLAATEKNLAENFENKKTDEQKKAAVLENFSHASAPLLPSTGPEFFAITAALGVGFMIFGARKK